MEVGQRWDRGAGGARVVVGQEWWWGISVGMGGDMKEKDDGGLGKGKLVNDGRIV